MRNQTEAWFERQLAHARECLALLDRVSTPQEIAQAHAALAVLPRDCQPELALGCAA